jgi:hypothetical protein
MANTNISIDIKNKIQKNNKTQGKIKQHHLVN